MLTRPALGTVREPEVLGEELASGYHFDTQNVGCHGLAWNTWLRAALWCVSLGYGRDKQSQVCFFGFVLFSFQPLNSLKSKFPEQRVDRPLSSQTKNGGVTEGSLARLTEVTIPPHSPEWDR